MKQYILDIIHVFKIYGVCNEVILYNLGSAWSNKLLTIEELHEICLFHGINIRNVLSEAEVKYYSKEIAI